MSPNLAADRNGDTTVLAHLDQQAGWGNLAGSQNVAVAEVDPDAASPCGWPESAPTTPRRWRSAR